ncbi:MAG: zinc-binding dehydrogenase [bacterium]|nr:zinc-binding dehydrogenase [bacterium]
MRRFGMASRRIWKISKAGSIDRLRLVEGDELPAPGPGEARVAVRSVGLNFADLFALQGLYSATPRGEFTPGLEFSGVIEELHELHPEAKSELRPGDRVMGAIRFGAYADRLNADTRYLRKIPAGWDFAEGAALPAQGLTAYYALRELGNLRPGQLVLIHSVAGGVGLLALEMVRKMGGLAIGTIGSPAKIPFLRESAGLDPAAIIVRDPRRFAAQLDGALQVLDRSGFDLVLDAVAGEYFQPAFDRLDAAGRLILFGSATMMTHASRPNYFTLAWRYLRRPRLDPIEMISENKSCMAFNLIWLWDKIEAMTRLYDEMLELDLAPPHVGRRFAFTDAHSALRFFQSGQSVGKVVLEIPESAQS